MLKTIDYILSIRRNDNTETLPTMVNDAERLATMVPVLLEALDCLPDGFALYDTEYRPLLANRKSLERFPAAFEVLRNGGSFYEANLSGVRKVRPEYDEARQREAAEFITDRLQSGAPLDLHTQNGRIVQVRFREMSEGRWVAISVDITEQRQREKELEAARKAAEAANEAKSAFLANISHEIRTPLNGILGMARMLSQADLPPEQQGQAKAIAESGQMLMDLLNDVLDLSKVEAGRMDIAPREGDLGEVMRGLRQLWHPVAADKGLVLSLMLDADLPRRLIFDPVRVRQCVNNLISNAIKFTDRGRVELAVAIADDADGVPQVSVEVRDTGVGMTAETLKRLFVPFCQGDNSTSRQFAGTGLGLSITRRLARLMGGDATAESRLGEGSLFRLTFRVERLTVAGADGSAEADAARLALRESRGLRVLLVDDHQVNRKVASLYLEPYGCAITEAANGREALRHLGAAPFDVVLLDIHMPVMDGPETIAAIREADEPWREVPVLALTADAMSGDRERYLALGMDGYVSKPIAERELVGEIVRVACRA